MRPKGLLVVDPHGQEFLLVPEDGMETGGYTLSVLQREEDQWVRLRPASSRNIRESLLGALLEFFGNLCRILNHSSNRVARIKRASQKSSRLTLSPHPGIPNIPMGHLCQNPDKIASKQSCALNHHEDNL